MRRIRDMLGLLLLIHIGLSGCASTEPQIKPPKGPEEYNAPPDNDPRYNKPIEYPKEAMEQPDNTKQSKNAKTPGQIGTGGPGMGGMGRPGGGY